MDEPLIWIRSLHFAATTSAAGAIFFCFFVGAPALPKVEKKSRFATAIRRRVAFIIWMSLVLAVATGVAWLVLQAERMSELSLASAMSQGAVWTVLVGTDFGTVWSVRFVLALLLMGTLVVEARWPAFAWGKRVSTVLAAALVAALAFAGHAGAGEGAVGLVHLGADVLHLVAAAAWVGALLPLAVVLGAARHEHAALVVARSATTRFSNIGIASVAIIVVTGIVNTWVLAGSVHALTATAYGRLLLLKLALFCVMLAIAAVNRLRLTPALDGGVGTAGAALRRLRVNCFLEAGLGAAILSVVGWLGTLPPGVAAA